MLVLGCHTWRKQINDTEERHQKGFRPPLEDLQYLKLYSKLPPEETHVAALLEFLKLRGGIQKIRLPRLAGIIS
jgi:hypothetical protein